MTDVVWKEARLGIFFKKNKFLGLRTSAHTGIPAEYKVKLEK